MIPSPLAGEGQGGGTHDGRSRLGFHFDGGSKLGAPGKIGRVRHASPLPVPPLQGGRGTPRRGRCGKQQRAGFALLKLARLKKPDDAVFAVIAGLADHLACTKPRDRLRKKRRAGALDLIDRRRLQDLKLRAEPRERLVVAFGDALRRRADAQHLADDLRQRN